MKRMVRSIVRDFMFCMFFILIVSKAHALPYSNIVIFGDSLSDTGNLFSDTGTPPSPYFNGQLSNGPIWANIFAQHFGLEAKASNLGGTNYAYAGATTGATGVPRVPPTLLAQTTNYLTTQGGVADPNALYVVFGGGNDLADALITSNPGLVGSGVGNVASIIGSLYGAGAKNLLVVNVPDVGKTPRVGAFGPAVQAAGTFLSTSWNSALDAALTSIGPLPGLDLDLFDFAGLQSNILTNAAAFGFSNISDPCFNGVTVCSNPSEYFFWDDFHPTSRVHQYIALAAIGEVPEPVTILLLGIGLAGILAVKRNRV